MYEQESQAEDKDTESIVSASLAHITSDDYQNGISYSKIYNSYHILFL